MAEGISLVLKTRRYRSARSGWWVLDILRPSRKVNLFQS